MIEIHALGKRRGDRWVVDDVWFTVASGEAVALCGGNGAGKTTILAIAAGALTADRGWVAIDHRTSNRRGALGYVPEGADPPGHLTGGELLALASALRRAPALATDLRDLLEIDPLSHRRIDRMSLGQRRRICLAAALVGSPPALLLDEPDNGLDALGLDALSTIIARETTRGASILLATHDPSVRARLHTRDIHLAGGKLVDP